MKCYKYIEHTSDLGIRVWGRDIKSLFTNSAFAMYDIISDVSLVRPVRSFFIRSKGMDRDELLRNWLSELLYCFHGKGLLLAEFNVIRLNKTDILSRVSGERCLSSRHRLKREIKAVTYHNLKIIKRNNKFHTDIIFDV
ncbi:MAG: archease [Candidatus Omnitrophica bacterium]|jgi:SHS2 domain-containing protein|nr:archease [Candidatus Omnitrophota bacterium]